MKNFFPANLKYMMLKPKKRWTQEALADELHVSRGSVAKWLAGDNMPSLENLRIMRVLFDRATIDEMLEEDLHIKDSQPSEVNADKKMLDALEEIKSLLKKRKGKHGRRNSGFEIVNPFGGAMPQFA